MSVAPEAEPFTGSPASRVPWGRHLAAQGLVSPFNASEIAVMGLAAVVADLPRLMRRIGETARAILAESPDCLVTIDSPDFTLRVARKVRADSVGNETKVPMDDVVESASGQPRRAALPPAPPHSQRRADDQRSDNVIDVR